MLAALVALIAPALAVPVAIVSFLFLNQGFSFAWLPGIEFTWAPAHPELVTAFALISTIALVYSREMEKTQLSMMLVFCAGLMGFLGSASGLQLFFFLELMLFPAFYIILQQDPAAAFKYFGFMQISSILVLAGITGTGKIASLLLTTGFAIKMGLFPFHSWLPDAHSQAPFPLSALLSGCVVACGAYGILQFSNTPGLVLPLGILSAVYGAFNANTEPDIKRLLAFSTISQMGFAAVALTTAREWVVPFLIMHAIAKASLFFSAGEIIEETGIRLIHDIGIKSITLFVSVLVSALSMLGIPPLLGFFTELEILSGTVSYSIYIGLLLAFTLFPTVLYSERLLSIFFKKADRRVEALPPLVSVLLLLMGAVIWMS